VGVATTGSAIFHFHHAQCTAERRIQKRGRNKVNELDDVLSTLANEDEEIRLVYITWTDSCAPDYGWCHVDDLKTSEYMVSTVGHILCETSSSILLAMSVSMSDGDKVNNPFIIPKCCIKSIVPLSIERVIT